MLLLELVFLGGGGVFVSGPSSAYDVELVVAVDVGVKEAFPCVHQRDLRALVNPPHRKTEKPIPQYPPDSSPARGETTPD